jgi:hypothetical protein
MAWPESDLLVRLRGKTLAGNQCDLTAANDPSVQMCSLIELWRWIDNRYQHAIGLESSLGDPGLDGITRTAPTADSCHNAAMRQKLLALFDQAFPPPRKFVLPSRFDPAM